MEKKIIFQKLTPTDSVDMAVYDEAFEYIFENDDVKNIAISGPYSAGKSSVLETYKKEHAGKKFFHISLAQFRDTVYDKEENNDTLQDDEKDACQKKIETILEGKILNQLIQQIDEENIPQTNFHVKRTISFMGNLAMTLGIVIFLLGIMYISYFKSLGTWVSMLSDSWLKSLLYIFTNAYCLIPVGIMVCALFGLGLYKVIKTQRNKNIFRKFSVQGNEIEIFAEDDNSYFDKYLNEVLYLFEKADVDVIVFEDMDRFDNNKIFERLREINILANIRIKKKEKNKVLRFFYLLRDDIFINKDRTKFFDYILPIVPVIDSSNAYNQIKDHFEKGGYYQALDDKFLRGLSLYIDDMRILKNIYNEFVVYYNKLNKIELNPNKMLAIITYKNIFPKDFADLQLNHGFVFELFNQKSKFVEDVKSEITKKIADIEKRIYYLKKEYLENIQDLDEIKSVRYSRGPSGVYNKWLNEIYPYRKQAIEDKKEYGLPELERKLYRLQIEEKRLDNLELQNVITRENIDDIFSMKTRNEIGDEVLYSEIKANEYFALLKYLIRYGYIDESYRDYMTFFYENSLTRRDKMFLRSITDRVAKPYTYELDDVQLVVSNLDISDFEQEEVLNFQLFKYLLENNFYKKYLIVFIQQLQNNEEFEFISEFYKLEQVKREFVLVINTQWSSFFEQISTQGKMSSEQIRDFSLATLQYMENEQLEEINVNGALTHYISTQKDYLTINQYDKAKISSAMKTLDVKFEQIDYESCDPMLFDEVYRNSLYQININNIGLMLKEKYKVNELDNAMKKCISTVFSQPEEPLCMYVQENMDMFIESVLSLPEDNFEDHSADIIKVINDDTVAEDNKLNYIGRLWTSINTLAEINEEKYRIECVKRQNVAYTAENILYYYSKRGLTDELVDFINNNNNVVDYAEVQYDEKKREEFWKKCVLNERLSNQKLEEILTSIGASYSDFTITKIPKDRMCILFRLGYISMKKLTLEFIRNNYPDIKMEYIKSKLNDYVVVAVNEMFSLNELKSILLWDIDNEIKLKLLSRTNEPISIIEKKYPEDIMLQILGTNLNRGDLPTLYEKFDKYGLKLQSKIIIVAASNMTSVINSVSSMSKQFVMRYLAEPSITRDKKISLFIALLPRMDSERCKECLLIMNCPDISNIFVKGKKLKISINAENQKILNALKENEFINNYTEDTDKQIYRIERQKGKHFGLPKKLL